MNAILSRRARRLLGGAAAAFALTVAHVGAQTWQLDPATAPEIVLDDHAGALTNLIVQPFPNGQILLNGRFNHIDGVAVRALARLNRDLTFDRSFNAEFALMDDLVSAAPLADGRVLVVIEPLRFEFQIVRLRADGHRDPTFPALDLDGFAWLVPLPGGAVLAHGSFRTLGGRPHPGFARFDSAGTVDSTFRPQVSADRYASVLPGPNGTILYTNNSLGSLSGRGLARLRVDGTLDPMFTPVVVGDHYLQTVQPDGSVVALAGSQLLRFRNDGRLDPNYAQDRRLALVRSISALPDGRVVVQAREAGRNYQSSNGPIYLLTLDGAIERELRSDSARGEFQTIIATLPDQRILLTHGLRVATPSPVSPIYGFEQSRPVLASIDGGPIEPLPAQLAVRSLGAVRGVVLDAKGRALIHGGFTHVNGQPRESLARLLPNGQLDSAHVPPNGIHTVLLMLPDGGAIVRRRAISPPDSTGLHQSSIEFVRVRPDGSIDPTFAPPSAVTNSSTRWHFAAPDGRMLVQGSQYYWLAPDGQVIATLPLTFTEPPNRVLPAASPLADGRMLFGGSFVSVNGTAHSHLVRLHTDGTIDASYTPDLSSLASVESAVPLADGRAVVFGRAWINGVFTPKAIRLDASGRPEAHYPFAARATSGVVLRDGSLLGAQKRFLPDGLRDLNYEPQLWSGNTLGQLESAAVGADGSLWIGGRFDEITQQRRLALARFLPQEVRAITVGPRDTTVAHGGATHLQTATGSTETATYQWTHHGVALPSATRAVLEINAAQPADAGVYRARVTLGGQTLTSAPATLTVVPNTARLVNLSARSKVEPDAPQIAGFVCAAPAGLRPILLRAVGFGFPGSAAIPMLPVPVLSVQDATRTLGTDRGSINSTEVAALARTVGAFPITTETLLNATWIRGSGLTLAIGSGAFTATTTSGNGNSGLSLFEFYDASDLSHPPLARNLSIRGRTSPGVNVLTAGFVIAGNGPLRVLVRGIGPGLAAFGLINPVPDPLLRVYASGIAMPLAVNAAWADDAALVDAGRRAGAFPLAANSRDTAVLLTLEPGAYTVQLAGAAETPAEALIELYALDR